MKKSPTHLQTDEPTMGFEEWYTELVHLTAKYLKIDVTAAMRYVKSDEAHSWYEDGFTPYVTFSENINH